MIASWMLTASRLPALELPEAFDAIGTLALQLQAVITGAIAHPLWAIAIVLFSIGLLQLLADLVKRLLRAVVTLVLRLPLILSQWIWQRLAPSKTTLPNLDPASTSAQSDPQKEKTHSPLTHPANVQNLQSLTNAELLDQLNQLKVRQDNIIATLRSRLSSTDKRDTPTEFTNLSTHSEDN